MELMGTPFVHEFERCPVLPAAMGREVKSRGWALDLKRGVSFMASSERLSAMTHPKRHGPRWPLVTVLVTAAVALVGVAIPVEPKYAVDRGFVDRPPSS